MTKVSVIIVADRCMDDGERGREVKRSLGGGGEKAISIFNIVNIFSRYVVILIA